MIMKFIKDKEIVNYILAKGGTTFFFRMIAMALSFITMAFITNYFGDAVFGSYSLVLTVLQVTVMVFALGIPNAFIVFASEYSTEEQTKGLLFKVIKINLLASLVPMLIFLLGAGFISEVIYQKQHLFPYFILLSLSIPFLIMHETICYYFISIKKIITYGLFIFIFPNVLFLIFLSAVYILKIPAFFTLLSYTGGIAVTVVAGILLIFSKKKWISPTISTKQILNKSLPMMMSGVFLLLLNWTDMLMLGRLETDSQIGIYNIAFKVGYLALFFVVSMNVVIMPKVSELFFQNKMDEMRKVINRATQIVILLTLPLALGIIFFSEFLLGLFGPAFVQGKTTLIIITLGALFNAMTGNVDQILNMTNNQVMVRNIFFIGFVLNVLLNLLLIPKHGIEGAAIASLITNVIVNTIFVYNIKKKLGFYTFM
jgi:O-antigen/teichoic acid export membrane protein